MKKWDTHGYNSSICNAWQEPEPDEESSEAKRNLEKLLRLLVSFGYRIPPPGARGPGGRAGAGYSPPGTGY